MYIISQARTKCISYLFEFNFKRISCGILYFSGRAEHLLPDLLKRGICGESEEAGSAPPPVAIVDPPRAGLHHKAVQALRASPNLRRLVYVACDAKAAYQRYVRCTLHTV